MSNLRAGFEKEVRLRLAQKAKPNQPEDVLLIKAFKYFDLNNSGTITKDEFYKAILRMGVNSFDEKQSSQLFDLYDENQNGSLDYKEFSSILFGTPRSPTKASKKVPTETSRPQTATSTVSATPELQIDYNDPSIQQSLNTLKDSLKRRGTTGILGFAKMFRIADDNNNKKVEFEEFFKVLRDYQVDLPLFHVQKLFAFFDKDRSGSVDYEELLMGIRGTLSPFRKTFVDKAFAKLDANGNGIIEVQDLKGVYDVSKHPDVINGKKRESDVLEDFLRTFESYSFYKGKLDNTVTHQEFEDYYGYISASIDTDEYFAQMMNSVWKLDQPSKGKFEESKSGEIVVDEYDHLEGNIGFMLKRLKQRLSARGPKAFAVLHKILRGIDTDKDGIITQKELLKALKDNRLEVTEQDAQTITDHYDNNRKGQLPYAAFFDDLVGKHNGFRRTLLDLAWNSLSGSKDNKVDISTLKSAFKGLRNHPDVKSGRKTDMQVTDEYNEAWDIFRTSVSRETTDFITRQEFDRFFLCLGATIEDDKVFEQTILQTFKIKPDPALKDWAGGAGGRKDFDPKAGYLQNMHRSLHAGGSVSSTAPYGTSASHENPYEEPKPTSTPGKRSGKAQQLEEERPTTRGQSQQGTPQGKGQGGQGLGEKDLLEYLRRKIISRGTRGILGIARLFKNIDDDNSKSISFQEFDKVLKDFRIDIVEEDSWKIFNYMDVSKDGNIDYEEFLRAIKGEMPENRQKIVIEVFERLDKDKNGVLTLDDIRELYNAKQHPDVKTGKKTEDDVLMEFLETFEQHHVQMTNKGKDNKVTLAEFIEYYNHISCSIDDDNYFEFMMNNCWNTNRSYKKAWRGDS